MDKQKQALFNLGLTAEEVEEVLATDKAIDQGADPFPLTADQKKASKKARNVGRASPKVPVKKTSKTDDMKVSILAELVKAVEGLGGSAEVTNAQREFTFTLSERKYKIVLSCPRT